MDKAAEQRTGAGAGPTPVRLGGPRIRELLERELAVREVTFPRRTVARHRGYITKLCAQLGELPACELTADRLVAYIESRKADATKHRAAPSLVSIWREIEPLRSSLERAHRSGDLTHDPSMVWSSIGTFVRRHRNRQRIERELALSYALGGLKQMSSAQASS